MGRDRILGFRMLLLLRRSAEYLRCLRTRLGPHQGQYLQAAKMWGGHLYYANLQLENSNVEVSLLFGRMVYRELM